MYVKKLTTLAFLPLDLILQGATVTSRVTTIDRLIIIFCAEEKDIHEHCENDFNESVKNKI